MSLDREWKYVLIGQTPVPEPDVITWAIWFETADRYVDQTCVGLLLVSTVFIGVDFHNPPLLFETAIFRMDGEERTLEEIYGRCATWLEAEEQHRRAVEEKLHAAAFN